MESFSYLMDVQKEQGTMSISLVSMNMYVVVLIFHRFNL